VGYYEIGRSVELEVDLDMFSAAHADGALVIDVPVICGRMENAA
jgi:hypothetical protein